MKDYSRTIFLVAAGVLWSAAAASGEPSAPGPLADRPEWKRIPIAWKGTWEETLAANKREDWQGQLSADKATGPRWQEALLVRRVEFWRQMIQRFPGQRARHAEAYGEIAGEFERAGRAYERSYWGFRLVRDFPDDPQAQERGYQLMLAWSFGQYTHWGWYGYWTRPECRDFEFAIHEIIARHKAGKLPDSSAAVGTAYSYLAWMSVDFAAYGQFQPLLRRAKEAGAGFGGPAQTLLEAFGHGQTGEGAWVFTENSLVGDQAFIDLEARWEQAAAGPLFKDAPGPIKAADVQALLDLIARTDAHLREGTKYTPYWTVLDQRLTALPRQRLTDLVALHQKQARRLADTVGLTGNRDELMRGFRRYPFASCLHERMIEAAEGELREGRPNWAIPVLWDVARHAVEPDLLAQSQAALWVALAQEASDAPELRTAMAAVPDETPVPWRGRSTTAGELKRSLLVNLPPVEQAKALPLAQLPRRRVVLPAGWPARERNLDGPFNDLGCHAPWPVSQVERIGATLIVSGPAAAARYDAGADNPAWVFLPEEKLSEAAWPWNRANERDALARGHHTWYQVRRPVRTLCHAEPPVSGRLYFLMNTHTPALVAAVDVFTGAMIWSSEGRHGWDGLTPLSQPTCSDGRVYLLAAGDAAPRPQDRQTGPPVHLVCLDAADGRVLWKRQIGWKENTSRDLARGTGPVVCREGGVYCSTGMGLLARLSAHDGMIEWLQGYPFAIHQNGSLVSINTRREGSAPRIVRMAGAGQTGEMILAAPRDHTGILAFSRQTGKLLWETPLTPSDKLVGVVDKVVIGINEHWLAGLDAATGNQLYCREFPDGTGSQGAIVGPDVVVVSAGKAYRLQPATGNVIETLDLAAGPDAEFAVLPDGLIVQLVPPPLAPPPGPATAARKIALPLKEVWSVPCQTPFLIFREGPEAPLHGLALQTGRRLAYVQPNPWRIAWERILPIPPQGIGMAGGNVVTASLWSVTAFAAENGRPRWSQTLPFMPGTLGGDAALTYAANPTSPYFGVMDSSTGQVKWSRSLAVESLGGQRALRMRRRPDGSPRLHMLANYPDPKTGAGAFGDVQLDAATGTLAAVHQAMTGNEGIWGRAEYDEKGFAWFMTRGGSYWGGGDHMALSGAFDGNDVQYAWPKRWDFGKTGHYYNRSGVYRRGSGLYASMAGQLAFRDEATGRELTYDFTRPGDALQPFLFDFREDAHRLIVVSGTCGLKPTPQGKNSPAWTGQEHWRMYVDIFDRATGKSLGRQELPGVLCCITHIAYQTMAGYETQVKILDDAILITDVNGLHVFAAGP